MLRLPSVRKGLQDLVGAQIFFGHGNQSGSHAQLTDQMAIKTNLSSRTIADSYDEAVIPFGRTTSPSLISPATSFTLASQLKLRERYSNFDNKVRFGRILEDLDTMAGRLTAAEEQQR